MTETKTNTNGGFTKICDMFFTKSAQRDYDQTPDVSKARWAEIKKKFPHFPANDDIGAARKEALLRLPAWAEEWAAATFLSDPRDAIMVSLIVNIVVICVPLSILLWKYPSHWLGVATWVFKLIAFLQRFILMMHYSEHRRLFKAPYHAVGKHLLNFGISPFLGIPCGMYRLHHVVMHHVENNFFETDLSSTEAFDRGNFFHFLQYYANYLTCVLMLPVWAY